VARTTRHVLHQFQKRSRTILPDSFDAFTTVRQRSRDGHAHRNCERRKKVKVKETIHRAGASLAKRPGQSK
jgi:hypothetical protein